VNSGPAPAPGTDESTTRTIDDDAARDALHILPLRAIPLDTPGLKRARLIKNVRLETVVELFNTYSTGSGQVRPLNINSYFESFPEEIARDQQKLLRLCQANSFDVYSLRIELRRMQIDITNQKELSLSDGKKAELTVYMKKFTRPLIKHVYGNDNLELNDVSDIISLFANPNRDEALRNLRLMAEKLNVELPEIPIFLEEYGDIFLSLAYFRRCIDQLVPEIQQFTEWMRESRKSTEIARDFRLVRMLDEIERDLTDITTSITGRFESFDRRSKDFWNDINAETFHKIRALISAHHLTIGGVLCGLAVKMNLWKMRFGRGGGGPQRRVEFIKSEILPGLSHIKSLEQSARHIDEEG